MVTAAVDTVQEWVALAAVCTAALVYVAKEALELAGKSPGAELLRVENADLVRRNQELESNMARHELTIAAQAKDIEILQSKVADLEKRDQAAVLEALKAHEAGAMKRHEENQALLQRAVNALEGGTA